ncbi:hypothetical protein ACFE04_010629 [Oxalis oulophora]
MAVTESVRVKSKPNSSVTNEQVENTAHKESHLSSDHGFKRKRASSSHVENGGEEHAHHISDENVQPDVELGSKRARQPKEITSEDLYHDDFFDYDDEEEDDSDWDPILTEPAEIMKWFCQNCTMSNFGSDVLCCMCGEHKKSGILKHGFFASAFLQDAALIEVESEAEGRHKDHSVKPSSSKGSTAIGFDERMLLHSEVEMKSHPHPERPDRLRAIAASLSTAGIFPGKCYPIPAREITKEELVKVHNRELVDIVEYTSHLYSSYFTPDTYANEHSALAARLAAGFCADLTTEILSGRARNGFALVRPPGHHAGVRNAMGFCLHNNAAVAVAAAQASGAKKVLILDWDVHHGNGTQEIFEHDKSVLYVSLHRHEGGSFYPGTGAANEVGSKGAEGFCVNVPWSRGGVGDNDYIFAFQNVVLPIAADFAPDFVIISAGFDAARGDPLGCCDITPDGYAQMTHMLNTLAGGKLLVMLEGGYNLRSISSSATEVIKVLLGEGSEFELGESSPSKAGLQTILEVLKIQMKFWPTLESRYSKLQAQLKTSMENSSEKAIKKETEIYSAKNLETGEENVLVPFFELRSLQIIKDISRISSANIHSKLLKIFRG